MPTRRGTTRTFTISFPPKLAEQVEQLAAEESRATSELFREAFRSYRAERILAVIAKSNAVAERTGHNGFQPEDVERLVNEVRAEASAFKPKRDR